MIFIPDCAKTCVHFLKVKNFGKEVEEDERCLCEAFPEGIPGFIEGASSHLVPIKGQKNDLVYKGRKDSDHPIDKILKMLRKIKASALEEK